MEDVITSPVLKLEYVGICKLNPGDLIKFRNSFVGIVVWNRVSDDRYEWRKIGIISPAGLSQVHFPESTTTSVTRVSSDNTECKQTVK